MIPVKIILPLNIRKGAGLSFDVIGIAPASGRIILMDGFKEDGETRRGISKWYFKVNDKDEKQWYWGGRVEEVKEEQVRSLIKPAGKTTLPIDFKAYVKERSGADLQTILANRASNDPIDYNVLLNVDESIKETKGEGVIIAVMDFPIRRDIRFKNNIVRPFNVERLAMDHGTFIAGIIAGNDAIRGIAPNATIVELPVFDESGNFQDDPKVIKKMFDFIDSFSQPVVVNVSSELPEALFGAFSSARNAIVVGSAGKDDMLLGDKLIFPAVLSNVISVGVVTEDFRSQHEKTVCNERLDFILPAFDYVSYSINGVRFRSESDTSSFATAAVTSLVALMISSGQVGNKVTDIKRELSLLSKAYTDTNNFNFLNSIIPQK